MCHQLETSSVRPAWRLNGGAAMRGKVYMRPTQKMTDWKNKGYIQSRSFFQELKRLKGLAKWQAWWCDLLHTTAF